VRGTAFPVTFLSSRGRLYVGTAALLRSPDRDPSDPDLELPALGLPAALPPDSLRGTAVPEVEPLLRR